MYDPERGWSLSFAGCGFLGFYHIGVTRCLSERAPHLLRDARTFFGCSSGALHCAAFLAGISLDLTLQVLMGLVREARKRNIGILHPSFNVSNYFREKLNKHLPDNIHQLVSSKMCVSLTRVSDGKNVLVSDFKSKEEVVDVLICSSFIPFYCGLIPPSFRGVRYVDGCGSDNMPFTDANTTITVSPLYGEHDICPKAKSTNFLHVNINKLSLRLCSENAHLLFRVLVPPDVKEAGDICLRGYLDTLRFLEEQGIGTRPVLSLNLYSEERELDITAPCWENISLEAPWETATLETWPEGDELLETLCPKLIIALREAIKDRSGYMSKMMNFFPLRIMSYVMLPCTLPVESAIALVQRLVMWFPDIPDDIVAAVGSLPDLFSHDGFSVPHFKIPNSKVRSFHI